MTLPRTSRPAKAPRKAQERPARRTAKAPGKAPRRPRGGAAPVRDVPLSHASLLAFVRAGGSVSLLTWIDLPPELQAALERAGTQVRAEFALAVAAAVRSPEGAEAVADAADGGMASDEEWARRALDKAGKMLARVSPLAGTGTG